MAAVLNLEWLPSAKPAVCRPTNSAIPWKEKMPANHRDRLEFVGEKVERFFQPVVDSQDRPGAEAPRPRSLELLPILLPTKSGQSKTKACELDTSRKPIFINADFFFPASLIKLIIGSKFFQWKGIE